MVAAMTMKIIIGHNRNAMSCFTKKKNQIRKQVDSGNIQSDVLFYSTCILNTPRSL